MVRLNVFIQVSEEDCPAALETARELAKESLKDNGYIACNIFESAIHNNVLMICETWRDAESLSGHKEAGHLITLVPKLQGLGVVKLEKFIF